MNQVQAMRPCYSTGPAIGPVTNMPRTCAARIDIEPVCHPALCDHVFKNALCQRRAADIPEAHKEDTGFSFGVQVLVFLDSIVAAFITHGF